ncbi:hypothetical protein [Propionivibrio soli]|uniref:hypothetical protein n=1 Tax=Propionivibrio soli TaxID=2976531 RepID=UPI0021E6DF51|nr:hypothetical protein [Propionivibrio soli]
MNHSAITSHILQSTSFIRNHVSEGAIAVLHLGEEQTAIAFGDTIDQDEVLVLSLGTSGIAQEYFNDRLPTPLALERAIQQVEDEIATAYKVGGKHFRLFTTDTAIGEIAVQAGLKEIGGTVSLNIAAVEGVFGRLVAAAEGQPISYAKIPTDGEFAARVLILRELMHHLRFPDVTYVGTKHEAAWR